METKRHAFVRAVSFFMEENVRGCRQTVNQQAGHADFYPPPFPFDKNVVYYERSDPVIRHGGGTG